MYALSQQANSQPIGNVNYFALMVQGGNANEHVRAVANERNGVFVRISAALLEYLNVTYNQLRFTDSGNFESGWLVFPDCIQRLIGLPSICNTTYCNAAFDVAGAAVCNYTAAQLFRRPRRLQESCFCFDGGQLQEARIAPSLSLHGVHRPVGVVSHRGEAGRCFVVFFVILFGCRSTGAHVASTARGSAAVLAICAPVRGRATRHGV